jgi:hypothetical protein
MKFPALLNPKSWFAPRTAPDRTAVIAGSSSRTAGVPMGSVKALPVELASRLFSFENRRRGQNRFVQGELVLPEAHPVRSDLFEDDVELVRRRKVSRLIHETRSAPSTPGHHDRELAINRLRQREPVSSRVVQKP